MARALLRRAHVVLAPRPTELSERKPADPAPLSPLDPYHHSDAPFRHAPSGGRVGEEASGHQGGKETSRRHRRSRRGSPVYPVPAAVPGRSRPYRACGPPGYKPLPDSDAGLARYAIPMFVRG